MSEQDAIERLRANVDNGTKSPMTHCSKANLRALLADYDALRTIAAQLAEALEERRGFPNCRGECCKDAFAALAAWKEWNRESQATPLPRLRLRAAKAVSE